MKKYIKPAAGLLVVLFCILMGCEKKEEALGVTSVKFIDAADDGTEEEGKEEISLKENADKAFEAGEISYTQQRVCVVHICGAVVNPGVYTLEEGSRIYQAVEKAGGFREDAREDYLNQADLIADGMKIYVPTCEETEGLWLEGMTEGAEADDAAGLVNINTADEERLCTLPGVGSAKARSIIAYREKNGSYQRIEDIMNVEGIKEGLFQKIRDSITV
ncbi:MAG: helix-hairpin-helix domain-containing protein [Bacillota bacterium]|nr:helix-hairpin-helix domain-containing protein [Bacillota bacterium]